MCLGHLFTYRDFKGTIGLAWVADPSEFMYVLTINITWATRYSWKVRWWNL